MVKSARKRDGCTSWLILNIANFQNTCITLFLDGLFFHHCDCKVLFWRISHGNKKVLQSDLRRSTIRDITCPPDVTGPTVIGVKVGDIPYPVPGPVRGGGGVSLVLSLVLSREYSLVLSSSTPQPRPGLGVPCRQNLHKQDLGRIREGCPPLWTDRHLWKHNLPSYYSVRTRAVMTLTSTTMRMTDCITR